VRNTTWLVLLEERRYIVVRAGEGQWKAMLVEVVDEPQNVGMGFTVDTHRVTVFSRTAILAPGGWASD
jgi:hypothetical protein